MLRFNPHSELIGRHAILSPSSYHWINYDNQKLDARYVRMKASAKGTALHNLAHEAIKLRVRLSHSDKTLSAYVRDGIVYGMEVDQPLYYSENCFGTADTIVFRKMILRIHDLKTGLIRASHKQLQVYAALFCLEYGISPFDIRIELRIYQNGEIKVEEPSPELIQYIMDKIVAFDHRIDILKERGL